MLGCPTMGSNCKLPSHRDRQSQAMSFGRDDEKIETIGIIGFK